MKIIGMIGGVTWHSTVEYYRLINEAISARLGEPHSAKIVLYSMDVAELDAHLDALDWTPIAQYMIEAARGLQAAGAQCVIIGSNTFHKVAKEVMASVHIPLIHIADATAQHIKANHVRKVGLLGTRFTMEENFYRPHLEQHGLQVLIPDQEQRLAVHDAIFTDPFLPNSPDLPTKKKYLAAVENLVKLGAEAIILGCTEIGLTLKQSDTPVRLFDTTTIHAHAAIEWSLQNHDSCA